MQSTLTDKSHRHHYIPKFFITGFIAPSKNLWIFDKAIGKILYKPIYPKGIFFENDRNTIEVSGNRVDIIESQIFHYLDNLLAKRFKIIQSAPTTDIQTKELLQCIDLMSATIFYRLPAYDTKYTSFSPQDLNSIQSPSMKKLICELLELKISVTDKSKLVNCIRPLINSYFYGGNLRMHGYYKFVEQSKPHFILSDNPILYESIPKDFLSLTNSIIFPLNSNRVYFGLKGKANSFNNEIAVGMNLLLAIQAKRYFGSPNREFLEKIVIAYKKIDLKKVDILRLKKELFDMLNK